MFTICKKNMPFSFIKQETNYFVNFLLLASILGRIQLDMFIMNFCCLRVSLRSEKRIKRVSSLTFSRQCAVDIQIPLERWTVLKSQNRVIF